MDLDELIAWEKEQALNKKRGLKKMELVIECGDGLPHRIDNVRLDVERGRIVIEYEAFSMDGCG